MDHGIHNRSGVGLIDYKPFVAQLCRTSRSSRVWSFPTYLENPCHRKKLNPSQNGGRLDPLPLSPCLAPPAAILLSGRTLLFSLLRPLSFPRESGLPQSLVLHYLQTRPVLTGVCPLSRQFRS
jgi:hypothetical protein